MVASELSGSEANTIPQENDIRTFGIIADPIQRSTGVAANTGNFDMTTRLTLSIVQSSFACTSFFCCLFDQDSYFSHFD